MRKYFLTRLSMALFAVMVFVGSGISVVQAGSLLDEMRVPDTCGTTYADKLASCTPFICQKPSPMATMFGFPSDAEIAKMSQQRQQKMKEMKAAAEKKMMAMSPEERTAMKARMMSAMEIKGYDTHGLCQTETDVAPDTLMRCAYDAPMLKRVSDYQNIIATANHIESESGSKTVNGKWTSTITTKADGKVIDDPSAEVLQDGTCKTLMKDADQGWLTMDQMNRMAHIELNIAEHGKPVAGHVRIVSAADGTPLFDKDVRTDQHMRKINLEAGTFDIEVKSMNPGLAPVWFRGIQISEAHVFTKKVEF